MNRIIELLKVNPWLELVFRVLLGAMFIYAGFSKLTEPAAFAKIIYGYQLFPEIIINLTAIILPFVEVFTGLALITGVWPRSSAAILGGLLLMFVVAISINLIRGHEFDCGCFSVDGKTGNRSAEMLLVRDIVWFLIAVSVVRFNGKRKFCAME